MSSPGSWSSHDRTRPSRRSPCFSGSSWSQNGIIEVLGAAAGIVIVSFPGIGVTTLAAFVGTSFVIRGLIVAGLGWMGRRNEVVQINPLQGEPI